MILSRMINIYACNIHCLCSRKMIHIRLHTEGVTLPIQVEVLSNELVRFFIFSHNRSLPGEIICHELSLKLCKLSAKACIDGSLRRWKFSPRVDTVAPVSQTKSAIDTVKRLKFLFHVLNKKPLNIG